MADPQRQRAIDFLRGTNQANQAQLEAFTTGSTSSLTGSPTADALVRGLVRRSIPIPTEEEREQRFISRNIEEGIPLDVASGVGPATRAALAVRPTMEDQTRFLQKEFGEDAVRLTEDKQGFIVRVIDQETGQPKDVLVDERETTMKDLVDLIGVVPELAGSIAAFALTKKVPGKVPQAIFGAKGMKGLARDVAVGTVGSQTGGAFSDIAVRGLDEGPINFEEILNRRVQQGAIEATLGGAMATGAKIFGRGIQELTSSPMALRREAINEQALNAVKDMEAKTGIAIPLSASQMTGARFLARTETFIENVPGGYKSMKMLKDAQEQKMRELQTFMLGQGEIPDAALVGRRAVNALRKKVRELEIPEEQAREALMKTATDDLLEEFSKLSLPERKLFMRDVGESIRGRAIEMRSAFRAESNDLFAKVKEIPGGTEPIVPMRGLKDEVNKVIESLPNEENIVENLTGLLDASGQEILRTETEKRVSRAYVPSNVKRFLEGHNRLPEKMTLDEVRQMRRMVNNAISEGESLPGIDTKLLRDISHALTKAVDDGVSALPDGKLKEALESANKHYRDNHGKFREVGIAELYKEPHVPGHIGEARIVKRIIGGSGDSDLYFQYQRFLGKDSKEFSLLKRSLLDDIYERNLIGGDASTLDAQSFLKDLSSMDRDIAKDLFQGNVDKIRRSVRLAMGAQAKIPLMDVERAMANPDSAGRTLAQAIKSEKEKDKLFKNRIIQRFVKGEIGEESLPADEFVNRFMDVASVPELQQIVNRLGPDSPVLEDIRKKTIQRLFHSAARNPTPEDLIRGINNDPTVIASGDSLVKAMGSEVEKSKLKTLLGTQAFELLQDYATIDAARMQKDALAGVAGSLVGGGVLNRLLTLKLGELLNVAKYRVVGTIIANPAFRQWVSGKYGIKEIPDLTKALVVTAPMIETAGEEFASESAAYRFLEDLQQAAFGEPNAQEALSQESPGANRREQALEFLRAP